MICAFYSYFTRPMSYTIYPLGAFSKISAIHSSAKESKDIRYDLFMPTNEKNFNTGTAYLLEDVKELCDLLIVKLKQYSITVFTPYQYDSYQDIKR